MFLFSSLFLISPIGLPGLGMAGVGKKVAGITGVLGILLKHVDYFLIFVVLLLFCHLSLKIYKVIYRIKLRKIEVLFYRLYSEILLLDKVKNSVKIGFSEQESIDLVLKRINTKLFIWKVGKRNKERMVDGLNFIKSGELGLDSSLMLVSNWVKMLSWLINNLLVF